MDEFVFFCPDFPVIQRDWMSLSRFDDDDDDDDDDLSIYIYIYVYIHMGIILYNPDYIQDMGLIFHHPYRPYHRHIFLIIK